AAQRQPAKTAKRLMGAPRKIRLGLYSPGLELIEKYAASRKYGTGQFFLIAEPLSRTPAQSQSQNRQRGQLPQLEFYANSGLDPLGRMAEQTEMAALSFIGHPSSEVLPQPSHFDLRLLFSSREQRHFARFD